MGLALVLTNTTPSRGRPAHLATWSSSVTIMRARPRSTRSASSSVVSSVVAGITTTPSFIAASMISHSGATLFSTSRR